MSFDVLQEKIIRMKNPTVVGLDPKPEYQRSKTTRSASS